MRVGVRRRPADAFMGRFGGGWQWALGFRAGGSTIIFDLLVLTVRVELK